MDGSLGRGSRNEGGQMLSTSTSSASSLSRALLIEQSLSRSSREGLIEVCRSALAASDGAADAKEVKRLRRLLAKAMESKKRESSQLIDKEVSLQRAGDSLSRSRSRTVSLSQSHPRDQPPLPGSSDVRTRRSGRVVDKQGEDGTITESASPPPTHRPRHHQNHHNQSVAAPVLVVSRTHGPHTSSSLVGIEDGGLEVVSPGRFRRALPSSVHVGMGLPPPGTPNQHPRTPDHPGTHHPSPASSRGSRGSKSFFSVTSPPPSHT